MPLPPNESWREGIVGTCVGYGRNATGGSGGTLRQVTNRNDSGAGSLRVALETVGSAWVTFTVSGTITLATVISTTSNKTIDGRGADITIANCGIEIGTWDHGVTGPVSNVIVENIKFKGNTSNGQILIAENASDVWVDHCTFQDATDEELYIGSGSSLMSSGHISPLRITISWCHFPAATGGQTLGWANKAWLISDPSSAIDAAITVTAHHNHFQTQVREPLARWVTLHGFNNYYHKTEIGAQIRTHGKFLSENDIFEAPYANAYPMVKVDGDVAGGEPLGADSVKVVNPWLIGAPTYEQINTAAIFTPGYPYTLDTANATTQANIVAGAGWQNVIPPATNIYAPGIDITAGSWTASPTPGTPLYSVVDEPVASDTDYIQSGQLATVDVVEVKYAGVINPGTLTGHVIDYRIRCDKGTKVTVSLVCATTIIKSWLHDGVANPAPLAFTTFSQTLTQGEAAAIADYADLRLRLAADVIVTTPPITPSATNTKYRNGKQYLFQSIPAPFFDARLDPAVYTGATGVWPGGNDPATSYHFVLDYDPAAPTGHGKANSNLVNDTPTHYFVDETVGWDWDVPGGDILDANLVHNPAQQTPPITAVPWHTFPIAQLTIGSHTFDVSTSVKYCQENDRWLAYKFLASGARKISSKFSASPPSIAVVYQDDTTATLACRVLAQLTTSSAYPQSVGTDYVPPLVMEFERPTKQVKTANLTLQITNTVSGGVGMAVYLADPLRNNDPVQYGIANAAGIGNFDAGIENNAAVIVMHRYMDGTALSNFEITSGAMNYGAESNYDPSLWAKRTSPWAIQGTPDLTKLPHTTIATTSSTIKGPKWYGGTWPHVPYQDSVRTIVDSTYTGAGYMALAPGVGSLSVTQDPDPKWRKDGIYTGSSASNSSVTDLLLHLPAAYWGTDHIFTRYFFRLGTPNGRPYLTPFAQMYQQGTQISTWIAAAFTRSGTAVTFSLPAYVGGADFPFVAGDSVDISLSTDTSALPNGDYSVVSVAGNTFVVTGVNAGTTSGTAQIKPNMGIGDDMTLIARKSKWIGRYDWAICGGKNGIMPSHVVTAGGGGGSSGVAGGGRGWQLRNRWIDTGWVDQDGPNGAGIIWGLHTYDYGNTNPVDYNYSVSDDQTQSDSGFAQRGGLGGMVYADTWYCFESEVKLNTVVPAKAKAAIAWTRSGTTITAAWAAHPFSNGDTVYVVASTSTAAVPLGSSVITVVDANTISFPGLGGGTTSGTFVNGGFLPDGIIRYWIDGRLAFERLGFVMRSLPYSVGSTTAVGSYTDPGYVATLTRPTCDLGLRNLWFNWFHGGITPGTVDRQVFISNLIAATQYIGPMKMPAAATLPLWETGQPLNTWVEILGTRHDQMQVGMNTIAAAGLCADVTWNSILDPWGHSYGNSRGKNAGSGSSGLFGDSGGCFRTKGSEMIVSGGGGAGTWAGNDVRGLRLEDDQPTWRVLVSPTNAQYAPKNDNLTTNTPYNLSVSALVATPADYTFALTDGAPVARHSYWHQFVDDVTDDFYWTRCDSVWQTDAGRFEEVNSIHLPDTVGATVAWPAAVPAARKHPVPHGHAEGAGGAPSNYCLTTKFPEVGDARDGFIYQIASGMWCFKPRAASGVGTWTSVTLTNAGILNGDKGPGAIDPTRNCFLFSTAPGTFHTSEPVYRVAVLNAAGTSATLFVATLTTAGGNLSAFAVKDVLGFADPLGSSGEVQDVAELEYDRGLDKFILFQDDQKLYTLTCTSTSTWTFRVDKLVDALTPSTVIGSGVPKLYGSKQGQVMAMWGRMRYVHALGGVCVIQGADQNAFFVRTRLINGV